MRDVKDMISSIENKIRAKSRKGYQALSRTFAHLRGKRGSKTGSVFSKLSRSKGGGHR